MQKRIAAYILAATLLQQLVMAQTVHQIPFASVGNIIELAITNTGDVHVANVEVRWENVPAWLRVSETKQLLERIEAQSEAVALFSCTVDKSAPVNQDQTLFFTVATNSGDRWTKEIKIAVAPPERFELFQNYPNPFNPATVIGFELPASGRVRLRVFDLLGREVAMLLDEERPAGHHEVVWDASGYSSGMYVYELTSERGGSRQVARKAMVLVR